MKRALVTLLATLAILSGCKEEGSYTTYRGHHYQGELRDGVAHGQGVMDYSDVRGRRYEGEWRDGYRHGQGTEVWTHNGSRYEGEFLNGKRHGKGVLTQDGTRYEGGEWRDGALHGQVVLTGCCVARNFVRDLSVYF